MYHTTSVLPEQSTVQSSMNTHGAQTCHTTASHLVEHTHTGPSSTSTGAGGSAPPHTLSGSANDSALVALLTVNQEPSHSHWSTP